MTRAERLAKKKIYRDTHKEAIKRALAQWRADNKVRIREYQVQYLKVNAARTRESWKQYYRVNRERLMESDSQRKAANADRLREDRIKRYAANPKKYLAIQLKFQRAHRGYVRAKNATRYAAKRRAVPSWFSAADQAAIQQLHAEAARLTAERGEQYHVDHEIPLQGLNISGLHVPANMRVLRGVENIRKSNHFHTQELYA